MSIPHRAASGHRSARAGDIADPRAPSRRRFRLSLALSGTGVLVMLAAAGLAGGHALAQGPDRVTVQPGENLSTIAARHLGDAGEAARIAAFNRIANPDLIFAGVELLLPPRGAGAGPAAVARRHAVQPGESLATIAERFYGSEDFARPIAVANDMANPDLIRVGQELLLPASITLASGATANPRAPAGGVAAPAAAPTAAGPLSGRRICVDPGHGGRDPGAAYVFENGRTLREADATLDIALLLAQRLRSQGAHVTLTRNADATLDLPERAQICNAARADLAVSVHLNGVDDRSVNGALALWGKPGERVLAEVMAATLQSGLFGGPGANVTAFGARHFPGRVLTYSAMPAVIVEPSFLTNPLEARALLAPAADPGSRRAQIAREVERGLLAYLR